MALSVDEAIARVPQWANADDLKDISSWWWNYKQ